MRTIDGEKLETIIKEWSKTQHTEVLSEVCNCIKAQDTVVDFNKFSDEIMYMLQFADEDETRIINNVVNVLKLCMNPNMLSEIKLFE